MRGYLIYTRTAVMVSGVRQMRLIAGKMKARCVRKRQLQPNEEKSDS
jgi:hypothetical protein